MKITLTNPKKTILKAVRKYVEFLSPTYGPTGNKILIIDSEFDHKAVDDGHMASNSFEIENEFENAVVQYIKETTAKTNSRVGDGTTTASLLMGAIVEETFKDLDDPLKTVDTHGISLELKKGLDEAIKQIKAVTKKIKTKEELYSIAYNSYNNAEIAKLISDTIFKIGEDGQIAIEDSHGMETTCEIVQGLELERGYASPYLINDDKAKATIKGAKVILVNKKIDTFLELVPIIKKLLENKLTNIVLIAEGFGDDVINNVVVGKLRGQLNPLLVEAPGFGSAKLEALTDLSVITGGKVAETGIGPKLDQLTVEDLGEAEIVSASKDRTIILGGKGKKSALDEHIKSLRVPTTNQTESDKQARRIAKLIGGVAVLKVGANTENEQKAIKAKVEDAVNATKIAFKDGVVAGAGKTYADIKTSSETLNTALKAPQKKLEENAKYLDKNVKDPSGVLIAALETAVSVASGLITMGGIVTNKRKLDKDGNYL